LTGFVENQPTIEPNNSAIFMTDTNISVRYKKQNIYSP
jgi:hypothetical protein